MRYFIEHVPKVTNWVTGEAYTTTFPYQLVMLNDHNVKTAVRVFTTHEEAQVELTTLRLGGAQST